VDGGGSRMRGLEGWMGYFGDADWYLRLIYLMQKNSKSIYAYLNRGPLR